MRLLAVGLAILCFYSALPVSAQQPADREAIKASAAAAAVELSRLEVAGDFDELYDLMHPDAQAVIPRAAVVGWYTNEFAPLHAGVSAVFTTLLTPWTWDVNGKTYWDAATVVYQQPFADGSVEQGQVHLVAVDGQWRWFFGKSREFVDEQITKYTSTPTPVPTSTPLPTATPLPTSTPMPTATPSPTATAVAADVPAQPTDRSDASRLSALETQTAGLQSALDEERVRNAVLATQVADLQDRVLALERQSSASAPAQVIPTTPVPATLPPAIQVVAETSTPVSPEPTATSTPPPTATPMPTSAPSPTPLPPTATPSSKPATDLTVCEPLADVRDLESHTGSFLGKQIAFEGTVVSLFDTGQTVSLGDRDPQPYKAQMQVAVEAPDGSYRGVVVGVNGDTLGINQGSTVQVCGTVVDTVSFTDSQGGAATQPLVSAKNVVGE